MGKVKPAPKGAEGKDKKSRQANPPKRSPRTRSRSESIAGTPPKGQNKEKRRLVATLRGTSTSPGGVKHSTSTGRKLSALSANKRRLEGSEAPSVPRKRQLSSPQQTTTSPVAAKPTEGSQPMRNGAPPMTVAEVRDCSKLGLLAGSGGCAYLNFDHLSITFSCRLRSWESKRGYGMRLCGHWKGWLLLATQGNKNLLLLWLIFMQTGATALPCTAPV